MKIICSVDELAILQRNDVVRGLQQSNEFLRQEIDRLNRVIEDRRNIPLVSVPSRVTMKLLAESFNHVKNEQKIDAIKALRIATGCALKEAKDMVEGSVDSF